MKAAMSQTKTEILKYEWHDSKRTVEGAATKIATKSAADKRKWKREEEERTWGKVSVSSHRWTAQTRAFVNYAARVTRLSWRFIFSSSSWCSLHFASSAACRTSLSRRFSAQSFNSEFRQRNVAYKPLILDHRPPIIRMTNVEHSKISVFSREGYKQQLACLQWSDKDVRWCALMTLFLIFCHINEEVILRPGNPSLGKAPRQFFRPLDLCDVRERGYPWCGHSRLNGFGSLNLVI